MYTQASLSEETLLKYIVSKGERAGAAYSFSLAEAQKELNLEQSQILRMICDLALRGVLRIREMPFPGEIQERLLSLLEESEIDYTLGRLFKTELTDQQRTITAIIQSYGGGLQDVAIFSPTRFGESLDRVGHVLRQLEKLRAMPRRSSKKGQTTKRVVESVKADLIGHLRKEAASMKVMLDRFSRILSKRTIGLNELEEKKAEIEIRHRIGEYSDEELSKLLADLEAQRVATAHDLDLQIGLLVNAVVVDRHDGEDLDEAFDILKARLAVSEIGLEAFEEQKRKLTEQLSSSTTFRLDKQKLRDTRETIRKLVQSLEHLSQNAFVEPEVAQDCKNALQQTLELMEKRKDVTE